MMIADGEWKHCESDRKGTVELEGIMVTGSFDSGGGWDFLFGK